MHRLFAGLPAALFALCLAAASTACAQAARPPVPTTPATISVYAKVLHHYNPQLPKWQSRDLARRVLTNAERWRIDTNLLVAIVTVESRWHTYAVSSAGAIGLGQLMPGTAARLGVDPWNAAENLSGAARYLSEMLRRYEGKPDRYQLACAAYNAGPKAVAEFGGIPPYYETQHYVVKVLDTWRHLAKIVRIPPGIFADALRARGPDVDYWLDAQSAAQ
jgi:soluble lytic murein transglycosylase-like protein